MIFAVACHDNLSDYGVASVLRGNRPDEKEGLVEHFFLSVSITGLQLEEYVIF